MQRPALISCRRQRTMDRSWRPCSADVACRCPTGLILRLRLLSYELTSDSFMLIRLSQTCTSPSISRLYHPSPFHMIYGLARRFVHKSVHNRARSSCVRLAGRLVTITMPNTRSWTTEAFTARHVPRWNWLSNKASCIATPRVDNRHSHEKLLRFHQMNQGRRAGVQLVAAVLL